MAGVWTVAAPADGGGQTRGVEQLPRVFSVAVARARGVEERRLRSRSEWQRPYRGIRATSRAQWIDTAAALVGAVGPDACLF